MAALYLWIALLLTFYGAAVLLVVGVPESASRQALAVALASGLTTGVGLALMFLGLKREEASRAIAITQIYPVVVAVLAVLAVLFLGETLAPLQWAAIALVVLGTMLISLRGDSAQGLLQPTKGTPLLLGAGLGLGLGFSPPSTPWQTCRWRRCSPCSSWGWRWYSAFSPDPGCGGSCSSP